MYERIGGNVHAATKDLDDENLAFRPDKEANSIVWLIWHTARGQDAQIAPLAGLAPVWDDGWRDKFNLPLEPNDTGYGHNSEQVAAVRASAELLTGYYDAVWAQTKTYLESLTGEAALDEVIDTDWNPPVTLGVRLVSIAADCLQHVGQANYLRGIVLRQK
jgi:hypothetical protein